MGVADCHKVNNRKALCRLVWGFFIFANSLVPAGVGPVRAAMLPGTIPGRIYFTCYRLRMLPMYQP